MSCVYEAFVDTRYKTRELTRLPLSTSPPFTFFLFQATTLIQGVYRARAAKRRMNAMRATNAGGPLDTSAEKQISSDLLKATQSQFTAAEKAEAMSIVHDVVNHDGAVQAVVQGVLPGQSSVQEGGKEGGEGVTGAASADSQAAGNDDGSLETKKDGSA